MLAGTSASVVRRGTTNSVRMGHHPSKVATEPRTATLPTPGAWAQSGHKMGGYKPSRQPTARDGPVEREGRPRARNTRSNARNPWPSQGFQRTDDGTRTRDPHLGKVPGPVHPVLTSRLTWCSVQRLVHP